MIKKLIPLFALSLILLQATSVVASDPSTIAREAHSKYAAGNFDEAAKMYRQAIQQGLDNGHLHYNLANAQYRKGLTGRAIASYRRALRDLPRDPDIKANLMLARKSINKLPQANNSIARRIGNLRQSVSDFELRAITLVFYFLTILSYLFLSMNPSAIKKALLGSFCVGSIVLTFFSFATREDIDGEFTFSITSPAAPAVVVLSEAEARSGNSEQFQVVFVLQEGAEIGITEQRGGWVEVILPGGRQGWIRREAVESI